MNVKSRVLSFHGYFEDFLMVGKPTYEELKQRVRELEEETARHKQTEQIAEEQARLLDLIFEHSLDSIVLLDKDYNFIRVSETYAKACQKNSSEFPGHNHFEFYPSNLKDEFDEAKMRNTIYQKSARPFIFPDHSEQDTTYWDLGLVPILSRKGEIELFLFTLKDVTERVQREAVLQKSEARFRTAFDSSSDCILIWDRDYNYLYANPAAIEHVGTKKDKVMGKNIRDGLGHVPDFMHLWMSRIDRIFKTGKEMRVQDETLMQGKRFLTDSVLSPIRDSNGEVFAACVVYRDLTSHKKTEEALMVRTKELDERVKELNCLYGISSLVQEPDISLDEIFQGVVDLIPSSWLYPEMTCARITLENKEYRTENFKESRWKQSSDIFVHGERSGSVEVCYLWENPGIDERPFLKEERNLINAIAERLGKISALKLTEKAFKSEHEKFQGVLNAIGEGLFIVNRNFLIEYHNEVAGKHFGDYQGRKCYHIFSNTKAPCTFCPLDEVIEHNKTIGIETAIPGGRTYNMVYSPFKDMDDNVKAIVILKDITKKKRLEAESIRAGHLASLGELAAGVAHEINNPIAGIIGYAEILRDEFRERNEDDEIPIRIIREGDRVAEIVKNLLAFSRDRKEEHSPAYIQDILSDAFALVERQLAKDGIKLKVNVSPDLPKIKVRTQEIQQVFLNIISNSRYALNERFSESHKHKVFRISGETLEIEAKKYVRITFHDLGTGISPHILDKIADPFYSTKPKNEGTGLGLSISHGIIKNHGGKLWFESIQGEYTKVMVDLPLENGWKL